MAGYLQHSVITIFWPYKLQPHPLPSPSFAFGHFPVGFRESLPEDQHLPLKGKGEFHLMEGGIEVLAGAKLFAQDFVITI